jgi:hypothetical protein
MPMITLARALPCDERSRAALTGATRLGKKTGGGRACNERSFHGKRADTKSVIRAPNVAHDKLCGQGPRAEAGAARRLPRLS